MPAEPIESQSHDDPPTVEFTMPEAELPIVLRGYDRDAVHAYLERVRDSVSEALADRTPDGAVKRALDSVGEETSAVLQRAHEIAEEVTARSRARADERLEQAELEARSIREAADARVSALDVELEKLWHERQRLITDIERIAEDLHAVVGAADERYPEEEESRGSSQTDPPEDPTLEATAEHPAARPAG